MSPAVGTPARLSLDRRGPVEAEGPDVLRIIPRDTESFAAMRTALRIAFGGDDFTLERYRDAIETGVVDERVCFEPNRLEALIDAFTQMGDVDAAKRIRDAAARLEGRGRTRLEELLGEVSDEIEKIDDAPLERALRKLVMAVRVAGLR